MVAPASRQIAEQFGVTSSVLIAMTVSVFVLGFGMLSVLRVKMKLIQYQPLVHWYASLWYYVLDTDVLQFLGPLSEIYGRTRVIQCSYLFFLGLSNFFF